MRREVHIGQPRAPHARLSRPDVERPAEVAHGRHPLEEIGGRLDRGNQLRRRARMEDVVGDDLELDVARARCVLYELPAPHADLALGVPRPAPDRSYHRLHEDLRVPEVRLEEEQLTARLQQSVQHPQVLAVAVVADDRRPDDVVEALRWKVLEPPSDVLDLDVRKVSRPELLRKPLVEDDSRDGALAPERLRQVLGPQPGPGTELEHALSGEHVEGVPRSERAPLELRGRGRRVAPPVRLARALHLPEVVLERRVSHEPGRRSNTV